MINRRERKPLGVIAADQDNRQVSQEARLPEMSTRLA
jgi:hypothetical protein